MTDAKTTSWLKAELVSELGFAEVDEIVQYITTSFHTHEEISSYLIELLGIPAKRAEQICTRLLSTLPSVPKLASMNAAAAAVAGKQEKMILRPKLVNSRSKPSKNSKGAASDLLNNSCIINCILCGLIEYNGARRCAHCDTELYYQAGVFLDDEATRQQMGEHIRLDEPDAQYPPVLKGEQHFYDEEVVGKDAQIGNAGHFITIPLDPNNRQVEVKISRNEQLATDARELVESIQRKMSKTRSVNSNSAKQAVALSEALVVVDDSYNLIYV
ncbi:uncharacterized protein PHALS_09999 [Plasmopara halstedii]|uniref:Activating signal cointegrator 1 N-terminal domain-containing protein n=1 Tax=Plasmopara halstedii TaxID=4781 RepID=A0A0N7L4V9_PLAHL|nr:uncharacterized protein PHALS_09999 [Plasmopara halstedii]CEG39763.1 hypothetical protein PHALS_09999 [Plasmopara halstedii]|eukprot:XP_024576132.1 hypothetical protein PHALS_09999 [Plasmopara halstedii]